MEVRNFRWDDPLLEYKLRAINVSARDADMILSHRGGSFVAFAPASMFEPATTINIEGA